MGTLYRIRIQLKVLGVRKLLATTVILCLDDGHLPLCFFINFQYFLLVKLLQGKKQRKKEKKSKTSLNSAWNTEFIYSFFFQDKTRPPQQKKPSSPHKEKIPQFYFPLGRRGKDDPLQETRIRKAFGKSEEANLCQMGFVAKVGTFEKHSKIF